MDQGPIAWGLTTSPCFPADCRVGFRLDHHKMTAAAVMPRSFNGGNVQIKFLKLVLFSIAVLGVSPLTPVAAQEADNTGTNPITFTYDWRTYFEMQSMPGGDNSLSILTIEQRMPLSQKVQFRFRVRSNSLSLDPDEDGTAAETSGIGDWDARLIYVPAVSSRGAVAVGLEASIPTASNTRLGNGKYTLGPQIFGVLFRPPGGGVLLAPAYQFVFSYAGDGDRADVRRSQFDLFYLWLASDRKWWILADPQAVIDHENDLGFALFEVEYGRMMFGGLSSYFRASFGIGEDRPYNWSGELGFKAIWR